MAFTNQQVLDQLFQIRDSYLTSGILMQKNIVTPDGATIFYRSLEDIESYINYYQSKVDADNGTGGYFGRMYFYG